MITLPACLISQFRDFRGIYPNSCLSSTKGSACCMKTPAVVQENRKRLDALRLKKSVYQGCSLFPLVYVPALELLLRRFRDLVTIPVLQGISLVGCHRARGTTIFVSLFSEMRSVKEAIVRFELIGGAKVNFFWRATGSQKIYWINF